MHADIKAIAKSALMVSLVALGWLASPCLGQTLDAFQGLIGTPCGAPPAGKINTTVTSGAITAGSGITITVNSITGIVNGTWLDIDAGAGTGNGNDTIATGDGHTTVFGGPSGQIFLTHGSIVANSLTITAGAATATDQSGRIGSYSGAMDGLVRWDDGWIYLVFATAPSNGTSIVATYHYLPTEVVQASSVNTGAKTLQATFLNSHGPGAKVYPGYYRTGKVNTNHWAFCDPYNNAFISNAIYVMDGSDAHVNPQGNALCQIAAGGTVSGGACTSDSGGGGKYGDYDVTYSQAALIRFRNLGINTSGPGSTSWYNGDGRTDSRWPTPSPHLPPIRQPFTDYLDVDNYAAYNEFGYSIDAPRTLWVNYKFYAGYKIPMLDWSDANYTSYVGSFITAEILNDPYQLGFMEPEIDYIPTLSVGGDFDTYDLAQGSGGGCSTAASCPLGYPTYNEHPNLAYYILLSPPYVNAAIPSNNDNQQYLQTYTSSTNSMKALLATTLQTEYGTIAALNTAWGVSGAGSYTTFGTTGTAVTGETVFTGNASATSINYTLASGDVDGYSLGFYVGGVLIGGDVGDADHSGGSAGSGTCGTAGNPWLAGNFFGGGQTTVWTVGQRIQASGFIREATVVTGDNGNSAPSWNNTLGGTTVDGDVTWTTIAPTMSACSINYSTGAIAATWSSAPASGMILTANYRHDGWGRGTGLLDEDGRNQGWVGQATGSYSADMLISFHTITGQNTTFQADMRAATKPLATVFFQTWRTEQQALAPDTLLISPYQMSGHNDPGACQVFQAGSPYLDVWSGNADWDMSTPWLNTASSVTPKLNRRQYTETCAGDMPWLGQFYLTSNADSGMHDCFLSSGGTCHGSAPGTLLLGADGEGAFNSQGAKGVFLQRQMNVWFNTPSVFGNYDVIGYNHWQMYDQIGEQEAWALISTNDNLYNGIEATTSAGSDPAVFTFCFTSGCTTNPARTPEEQSYGDYTDALKAANASALASVGGTSPTAHTVLSGQTSTGGVTVSH